MWLTVYLLSPSGVTESKCSQCSRLISCTKNGVGFYELLKRRISLSMQLSLNARTQLSSEDDLILYGCHLLTPVLMRWEALAQLHDSLQARHSQNYNDRARFTVYWPGILCHHNKSPSSSNPRPRGHCKKSQQTSAHILQQCTASPTGRT